MIWSETFAKSVSQLEQGNVVSITGRFDLREEGARISANEVKPLKKPAPRERPLILKFDRRNTTNVDLEFVRTTLTASPGPRRVEFVFVGEDGRRLRLLPSADFYVTWNEEVKGKLAPWVVQG